MRKSKIVFRWNFIIVGISFYMINKFTDLEVQGLGAGVLLDADASEKFTWGFLSFDFVTGALQTFKFNFLLKPSLTS